MISADGQLIDSTPNLRKTETLTKRFLTSVQVNDEDRVGTSASVLDDIGYWVLIRAGVTPTAMSSKVHVAETGVKLAHEKTFLEWLGFVKRYRSKHGDLSFGDNDMLTVLQKLLPDDGQLVSLLQTLRKRTDMESHANTMIRFLFSRSPSTRTMMNTRWLDAGEDPAIVFKILRLDDALLFQQKTSLSQWLDYIVKFRVQKGEQAFTDKNVLRLLMDTTRHSRSTDELAALLQSFKEIQGIENIASKLQSRVFTNWINSDFDPVHIAKTLNGLPENSFPPSLTFKTTEAYALQYAAKKWRENSQESEGTVCQAGD
ncbi:hypothetical protein DVH05_022600 [Phytophthora capsici]|nr:hypothetical protein DVH05_018297 [Phytophthora capsici]KAG1708968.1 hypothetical protein DVH05_022600 [Phytophthora capsici]|eukprot:jgi/Phyca11/103431/e_gw1.8.431.1